MLQALELENFKAFGERSRIPFAPITLIFGENSAGKSSILQVLNLLKQTRESRESGALLLPRAENGIVDLGSFQEMIFNHDLDRTLSLRIETDLEKIFDSKPRDSKPRLTSSIAIEFCFKRPSLDEEVLLDSIEIFDAKEKRRIAKFRISGKTVDPRESWMMMRLYRDSLSNPTLELAASECVSVTKASSYWTPEFEWCKKNKKKILDHLSRSLKESKQDSKEPGENDDRIHKRIDSINEYIELFSSESDLNNYISIRHSEEMKTVLGLNGFLPVGTISDEKVSSFLRTYSTFNRTSQPALDVGNLARMAGIALDRTLDKLFPMGPFRRPPERWYIFTGTSPKDVGYRGDLLPDLLLRRPKLVKETNEWLKKLDMGYDLDVKPVGKNSGDLFEVRLIDTRRKKQVNVALPDVGFGISQLLPFVVQSLISENQIISIEQPEVHVHPKLQADLGDLLAHAIQKPRQNRFIIETHSEHLILRLQRLVRKGDIKPEDVSVIYISRQPEGAKAERLHLDEDGDFIDDWPNGFFPERLRELR